MDSAVNNLLDVDKQARQVMDEAQQYYEQTLAEVEAEKKKILEKYREKADKHIEATLAADAAVVDEAVADINARSAELGAAMDKTFSENRADWEDQLFARCVGR